MYDSFVPMENKIAFSSETAQSTTLYFVIMAFTTAREWSQKFITDAIKLNRFGRKLTCKISVELNDIGLQEPWIYFC